MAVRIPFVAVAVSVVRDGPSLSAESREIHEPAAVAALVRGIVGGDEREHFIVLQLDARNRLRAAEVVSIGTLTASLVHPREVFRSAIINGAAGIVLAHNHPSGDPTPSPEDKTTTTRLVKAGELLGIAVLDHVVVGEHAHKSFREEGLL